MEDAEKGSAKAESVGENVNTHGLTMLAARLLDVASPVREGGLSRFRGAYISP
jgi:hypothetical protein